MTDNQSETDNRSCGGAIRGNNVEYPDWWIPELITMRIPLLNKFCRDNNITETDKAYILYQRRKIQNRDSQHTRRLKLKEKEEASSAKEDTQLNKTLSEKEILIKLLVDEIVKLRAELAEKDMKY